MFQRKICASLVVMLGLVALPALAQQQEPEQHHPPAASPTATAAPGGGMSGGSMPGMGGMPMMGMMRMMMGQDCRGSMPMMAAMAGHVEGRLAFLKTELKITDAQLPLWNAVAVAIRASAKSVSEMPGSLATTVPALGGGTLVSTYSSRVTDNILRLGVNYKFGGPGIGAY